MRRLLWLFALGWIAFVPTALAQTQSCYGAFDSLACEQAHHDPGIAVLGGAVTVVAVATGVAVAGPTLFPWAKGIDDSMPLGGEEEADPELEEEPLADPFDGRLLPMKKGDAWWQDRWLPEEEAEARVEDGRRDLEDRDRVRKEFAKEGGP
jgi:hypothetical protein